MQLDDFNRIFFKVTKFKKQFQIYNKAVNVIKSIASDSQISLEEKKQNFSAQYKSFYQKNVCKDKDIQNLKEMFDNNNLDSSLFTDILLAYDNNITTFKLYVWEEFVAYHRLLVAPLSRFVLAIYDENPTTYLPMENLYTILEILSSLSSIKKQIIDCNQCIIPQDIMQKYDVKNTDLTLSFTTPNVQSMMQDLVDRINYMQADVQILPSIIKNFGLRVKVNIIISLTNSMIKKYKKSDIIHNLPEITLMDKIKAFGYGIFHSCYSKRLSQGRIK